nr:MAG TPA: hypothetical protein [Caudoviricetes sp.]
MEFIFLFYPARQLNCTQFSCVFFYLYYRTYVYLHRVKLNCVLCYIV